MLGFRAFDRVRLKPRFQAAAAMLVGVLGVTGSSSRSASSLASCAAKGSEFKNEWFCCVNCWSEDFVLVTRLVRLDANLLDLRGGSPSLLATVAGEELWVEMEAIDEMDMRRMELG